MPGHGAGPPSARRAARRWRRASAGCRRRGGTWNSCDSSRSPSTVATTCTVAPGARPDSTACPVASVFTVCDVAVDDELHRMAGDQVGQLPADQPHRDRARRQWRRPAAGFPTSPWASGMPGHAPPVPPICAPGDAVAAETGRRARRRPHQPFAPRRPRRAASSFSIRSRYAALPRSSCRIRRIARRAAGRSSPGSPPRTPCPSRGRTRVP